ncbi:hypothetical protein [Syntrophomonas palmitatica]|uniref:hypothetical protein n=1 Tax=Syntrophomonas palmitatica TaxID=402877 RepID=UPI0006D0A87A|nr:hypothetical protein [Syntrophomonas palmitatica]
MTDSTKIVARVMSLVITSVILSLVFVSFALARRDADTYPSNIWLGGVYIGNLTREEALNVITNQLQNTWGKNYP